MTEIKIEKKTSIWPWIFLLLGIIAAIWFFFFRTDETNVQEVVTDTDTEMVQPMEDNNAVSDYIMFVNNDPDKMGLDHEYSSEALNKLTTAVEATANKQNFDISADIAKARQFTEEIQKDPTATNHSDKIKGAADILSMALKNLQQEKYSNLTAEADSVKAAAAGINPAVLTLDQKDAVKNFFTTAADLLTKMN
ncbi:hypothetical protein RCH18_002902 [Flavobacterium sp. PL11]|uniref:hypothetical protein n=1 Tax=Flavobacterium sp. PL11 TaxID=3071717 RepID=UPI002E091818|nr:hypothetical protein [Flavobacterium sp. PL11]